MKRFIPKTSMWVWFVLGGLVLSAFGQMDRLTKLNAQAETLKQDLAEVEKEIKQLTTGEAEDQLLVEGRQKFEMFCMTCHFYKPKPGNMLAPPVFAIRSHYLQTHANEKEFREAITAYASSPSEEKSLMPGAIMRFKIMPPIPVGTENLKAITHFLYHTDFSRPGC